MSRSSILVAVIAGSILSGCQNANTVRVGEAKDGSAFLDVTDTAFTPAPQVAGWPGMALFDYDNDGDIDVFVTSVRGPKNMFYQNQGNGRFDFFARRANLERDDDLGVACGVGDFDNDGWLDLIIARQVFGPALPGTESLVYMKNMGPGDDGNVTFEDKTQESGLNAVTFGASIGVGDFDNDGLLDLYIGRYDFRDLDFRFGTYLPDTPNALLRNTGVVDGVPIFADITESAGVAGTRVAGLAPETATFLNRMPTWAVYITDVNQDGLQDIFALQEIPGGVDLFINNGDLTFTTAQADLLNKHGGWMGAAAADFNRDGNLDYFLTNIGADAEENAQPDHLINAFKRPNGTPFHRLLRTDDAGNLTDVAGDVPVAPGMLPPINRHGGSGVAAYEFGFGCAWLDVQNDGWPDLYWTGDIILDDFFGPGPLRRDYHGVSRFLVADGRGGFIDQTAQRGLFTMSDESPLEFGFGHNGRAVAAIDLNGDGFADICRTSQSLAQISPIAFRVFFNPAQDAGHWLTVRLTGTTSNRFGIGARVEARAGDEVFVNEVVTTTSAFTAVHPQVHFGLGEVSQIDTLIVRWPSGTVTETTNVAADQVITIEE